MKFRKLILLGLIPCLVLASSVPLLTSCGNLSTSIRKVKDWWQLPRYDDYDTVFIEESSTYIPSYEAQKIFSKRCIDEMNYKFFLYSRDYLSRNPDLYDFTMRASLINDVLEFRIDTTPSGEPTMVYRFQFNVVGEDDQFNLHLWKYIIDGRLVGQAYMPKKETMSIIKDFTKAVYLELCGIRRTVDY